MAGVPILKMYRDWKDKRPERPIFRTILVSMLAVLLVEIVLMTASIWMTDVPGQLDQNAKDILEMQVHNRASYLSDLLVQAQDLAELSDTINQTAQALDTLTDSVKKFLRGDQYETVTNREQVQRANDDINARGIDAVVNDLLARDKWTADDHAAAAVACIRAQNEGLMTTAYVIAKAYDEQGTNAGQALQARQIIGKLTAEGALVEAAKKADHANAKKGLADGDIPVGSQAPVKGWRDRQQRSKEGAEREQNVSQTGEFDPDNPFNKGRTSVLPREAVRALTKILREKGTMNGMITTNENYNLDEILSKLKEYTTGKVVEKVTCEEKYVLPGDGFKVALMDFGAKRNIARSLNKRGCEVTVYPALTTAEEILAANPDGIMLSNGPGDPKECVSIIKEIKKLYDSDVPIFAICLGHQLMALATGADTHKMKYGHRGANHPVKDLQTGKVYISSQNHGYVVDMDTLDDKIARPAFINVNDKTNEGLEYVGKNIFTVQFHPEACAGPKDSDYLFDRFMNMMKKGRD